MYIQKRGSVNSPNRKSKQYELTPEMVEEIKEALKEVEHGQVILNDKFREKFSTDK